jgi:hypothetical protein
VSFFAPPPIMRCADPYEDANRIKRGVKIIQRSLMDKMEVEVGIATVLGSVSVAEDTCQAVVVE